MRRAFEADVLACPKCGGRMTVLATIEDLKGMFRNRSVKFLVAAGLAVTTLLAGPVAGDGAWARGNKVKAVINGEKFRAKNDNRGVASILYGASTGSLSILTLRQTQSRDGIEVSRFDMKGQVENLLGATLPLDVPVSSILEHEVIGPSRLTEVWKGDGVTLTITRLKNGRLKGTFRGTVPVAAGPADAVVEKGVVSLPLVTQ